MRALLEEPAYQGRLTLEVLGWTSERGLAAQASYGFGPDRHGLAVLDAQGRLLSVRPGHDYGTAEIRADFDRALR